MEVIQYVWLSLAIAAFILSFVFIPFAHRSRDGWDAALGFMAVMWGVVLIFLWAGFVNLA